jgi:hypothetical protein
MAIRPQHSAAAAAGAAGAARRMLDADEALSEVWRHGVVQLLDDYESVLRHEGPAAAAAMFAAAPDETGDQRVDAAFAGLAEHLARRDGWPAPAWTREERRSTATWWFVASLPGFHPRAMVESPLSFRKRGVFITSDALERA